jgi:biotin carboxyl carrier protein
MKLRITLEGKTYEVDVEIVEPEEYGLSAVRSASAPLVRPAVGTVPRSQPTPPRAQPEDSRTARAPIAGTVNQVKVRPGDQVKENDLLVVLEAMKMESNVYSPLEGKIKQVNVSPGYRVVQGQVLVEFE